jgi:hypothetical protein
LLKNSGSGFEREESEAPEKSAIFQHSAPKRYRKKYSAQRKATFSAAVWWPKNNIKKSDMAPGAERRAPPLIGNLDQKGTKSLHEVFDLSPALERPSTAFFSKCRFDRIVISIPRPVPRKA